MGRLEENMADALRRLAEIEARDGGPGCTRLSEMINDMLGAASDAYPQRDAEWGWLTLARLLWELRARRSAMGREPDDERNAAADLCCCDIDGVDPEADTDQPPSSDSTREEP